MNYFFSNVGNFVLYSNRCNLPEYNRQESLRALRPDPCPICHISPEVCCESHYDGYSEYYEVFYIRCRSCGLSLPCLNFDVSVWNRLSFVEDGFE